MKTVYLLYPNGSVMIDVQLPDVAIGPDTIRVGEAIFVRQTHDKYMQASCYVVGG